MELKMTDFEIFKIKEQEKIRNKKNYSEIYESNAVKKNIYGGRRFLGFTPMGKDVWATMKYVRDTRELFLKTDKGFKDLYKEGARLFQSADSNQKSFSRYADKCWKRRTIRLLNILRYQLLVFKLFQYVASIVYTGDAAAKWMDAKMWNIPVGSYVDSFQTIDN